jgi:hypothetical protein
MPTPLVFAGMFALSLCAWTLVLRSVVAPRLAGKPRREALALLALPECFRHVSALLLVPGVANEGLAPDFVTSLVVGDVLTAVLAMVSILALREGARWAIASTWIFNVIGTLDLLKNVGHGMIIGVADSFGAAAVVPTMVVPLMLAIHVWIFAVLTSSILGGDRRGLTARRTPTASSRSTRRRLDAAARPRASHPRAM